MYGQPVTFTATVAAAAGSPTPAGTVDFDINGVQAGQANLSDGVAQFTPAPPLVPGSYTITAFYVGSGADLPSDNTAAPLTQTVNLDDTAVTISASTGSSSFGEGVTFTAHVTANAPGSGTPTGTVEFYSVATGTLVGVGTLVDGALSVTNSMLEPGGYLIAAQYFGDNHDFNGSTSSSQITLIVSPALYVLDPSAAGALSITGTASLNEPGPIYVNSTSASAIVAAGYATATASSIDVVGGTSVTQLGSLSPDPVTGALPVADPLASQPVPIGGNRYDAVDLTGSASETINPGLYPSIDVSGDANLTLNPGIYVITGGGVTVSDHALLTGTNVVIYNTNSSFPVAGGTFGSITFMSAEEVRLSAPQAGDFAGIAILQPRANDKPLTISGSLLVNIDGTIDAPTAKLTVSGSEQLTTTNLVVGQLAIQDSGSIGTTQAAGATALPRGPLALTSAASARTAAASASTFAVSLGNGADIDQSAASFDEETLADVAVSLIDVKAEARKRL